MAVVGGDESDEFLRQNLLIRHQWGPTSVPVCETLCRGAITSMCCMPWQTTAVVCTTWPAGCSDWLDKQVTSGSPLPA